MAWCANSACEYGSERARACPGVGVAGREIPPGGICSLTQGRFFVSAIEAPHDWEELRRDVYGPVLRPLVRYLVDEVQHEAIVCALL